MEPGMNNCIRAVALCLLLTAGVPSNTSAQTKLTGADFLSACTRPTEAWISFCHGYVQAVFDGVERPGEKLCPPAGTTRAKIVGDVVRHLKAIPKLQKHNAAAVVYGVLFNAYRCR